MIRKIVQVKDDRGVWQDMPNQDYRTSPEQLAMDVSKTGVTTRVIELGTGEDGADTIVKVYRKQRKKIR